MKSRKSIYRRAKFSDCPGCKCRNSCELGRVLNTQCRHVTWYAAEPIERLQRIMKGGKE